MKSLNEHLVKLVTETVEDIAKVKGYQSYPKEQAVIMVLTALLIVNEAIRRKKSGTR